MSAEVQYRTFQLDELLVAHFYAFPFKEHLRSPTLRVPLRNRKH
jgi:hypothetical protein